MLGRTLRKRIKDLNEIKRIYKQDLDCPRALSRARLSANIDTVASTRPLSTLSLYLYL